MGAAAYGSRLSQDDVHVRYSFGVDPGVPEGVLVIPLDDPGAVYAEDRDRLPMDAERVFWKALRMHRQTGTWPEHVAFQS
ncbi:hypothetical protein [Cellulomonas sp. S1-8]|uniref:hypothetical protein n=1 Tax=Cellulomonas sp. S1-8 TaxID=2904790 RepID=UPI002244C7E2|nr:hypothetical protein [Cellulomonas sp. S1-8]UZN03864.1 hypothetical protein OKX07_02675 [Cellulomonas sp. S1-8]